MIDRPADLVPWSQAQPARPPATVVTAVVLTWLTATGTAALTLFLTVGFLWVAGPVFEVFEGGVENPRWWIVGAAAIVLVISAAADAAALFVLRGRRWAGWTLVGLCLVAAIGGVLTAYYIAPILVSLVAMTVATLLLMPSARAWPAAAINH